MPEVGQSGASSTGAQSGIQIPQRELRYKIVGNKLLDQFDLNIILRDIADRIEHGRRLIIPIGMPQAGKSMFIASLIAYAFRRNPKEDNSTNFTDVFPMDSGVKNIIDALDKKELLPTTRANEITIIDLDMHSRYHPRLPVRITLIDLSGEDIARLTGKIKDDRDGSAAKIEQILAACIAQKAIFAVLTPVDEKMTQKGMVSQFDKDEADEMKKFIDKIKLNNPQLYRLTKFLMVVTKWDNLPIHMDTATYLKLNRNRLYNEYTSNSKSYGLIPYSVGNVVSSTIVRVVLRSPKNFWYTFYRWSTGKHVLPWWKRLFS